MLSCVASLKAQFEGAAKRLHQRFKWQTETVLVMLASNCSDVLESHFRPTFVKRRSHYRARTAQPADYSLPSTVINLPICWRTAGVRKL